MTYEETKQNLLYLLEYIHTLRDGNHKKLEHKIVLNYLQSLVIGNNLLSAQQKFELLLLNHQGYNLVDLMINSEHILNRYFTHIDTNVATEKLTESLLLLLEQDLPAANIYTLLLYLFGISASRPSIYHQIAANRCYLILQTLFKILLILSDAKPPVPVSDIFALLHHPASYEGALRYMGPNPNDRRATIFNLIHGDIDGTQLREILKKALTKHISFDLMRQNPKVFVDQLATNWQQVTDLLKLLPWVFYDGDLLLLGQFANCYGQLKSNTLEKILIPDNSLHEIMFLHLLGACLERPECRSKTFKCINFQCDLKDASLITPLAKIFEVVKEISFANSPISNEFVQLLHSARYLAGVNYRVRELIYLHTNVMNNAAIKSMLDWIPGYARISIEEARDGQCKVFTPLYPPRNTSAKSLDTTPHPGVVAEGRLLPSMRKQVNLKGTYQSCKVMANEYVTSLTIHHSQIIPSMLENDAFLQFLNQMPKLEELILDISFVGEDTKILFMQQVLRNSRIKKLIVVFKVDDPIIGVITDALKTNNSLRKIHIMNYFYVTDLALRSQPFVTMASVLSTCNNSLSSLTVGSLNFSEISPRELYELLRRNRTLTQQQDNLLTIEKILAEINNFVAIADSDICYLADVYVLKNQITEAYFLSEDLKKQNYPTAPAAAILCERVALAYSFFLHKIQQRLLRYFHAFLDFTHIHYKTTFLDELENHCKNIRPNSSEAATFYLSIFALITRYFDKLLIDEDKTKQNSNAPQIPSADRLLNIIVRAPIEDPSLSPMASHLLYLLYKQKIGDILNIIKKPELKQSVDIILATKDLSSLTAALGKFCSQYKAEQNALYSYLVGDALLDFLIPLHTSMYAVAARPAKNATLAAVSSDASTAKNSMYLSPPSPASANANIAPSTSNLSVSGAATPLLPPPYKLNYALSQVPPTPSAPPFVPVLLAAGAKPAEEYTGIRIVLDKLKEICIQLEISYTDFMKDIEKERPEFFSFLTEEIMPDPVTAADDETYDRAAINKWIAEQCANIVVMNSSGTQSTTPPVYSPAHSGKVLINFDLRPNLIMRRTIFNYLDGKVKLLNEKIKLKKQQAAEKLSAENDIATSKINDGSELSVNASLTPPVHTNSVPSLSIHSASPASAISAPLQSAIADNSITSGGVVISATVAPPVQASVTSVISAAEKIAAISTIAQSPTPANSTNETPAPLSAIKPAADITLAVMSNPTSPLMFKQTTAPKMQLSTQAKLYRSAAAKSPIPAAPTQRLAGKMQLPKTPTHDPEQDPVLDLPNTPIHEPECKQLQGNDVRVTAEQEESNARSCSPQPG